TKFILEMVPQSRFETYLVALDAAICLTDRPMSMHNQSLRRKAIQMLLLATVFWGMSFPTMKSVVMVQQQLLPNASTWFFTSLAVTVRFGLAFLIMLFWTWSTFRRMS